MMRLLITFVVFLIIAVPAWAQGRDSFDIASFTAPAGWKRESKDNGLVFTTADEKKGTYAMIVLYKSDLSARDPKSDFDADWRQFIAGAFSVKAAPEMEPQKQVGGWTITTGGSAFESELGTSAIILSTYSGFGRKFSAAAVFNSQDHIAAIDAFASSIVLSKPAQSVAAPAENSILGTWGSNAGATMTYGDPLAASMSGYSKSQYTLNADGTYVFNSKTFRMGYDKIILVRESGTYQISGGTLSIKPQKSVIQAWSKLGGADKFGTLLTSQNRKLEAVNYRFTKHYFSGIDQWQLVLQADAPTDRDGPYSTFTLFPNAWYYSPISSTNPLIELPAGR